ncbi:PREDICTED: LOB domain-containing protein 16-like [Ipomoea nil]|uniref:LOB domain-containing protein 16-like n=1 Tax=Ipomoea nil TaxID=35883 RepID=UPI000900BF9A|nr:PREDICTED: LOB domain-containing protein 16-like [Ipomoea nil]
MAAAGSPCGACKFLRRKCAADCIFAPYFCSDQGPARFAAIHKVFGASNVSKMLMQVSVHERCDAVVTIDYEARARIKDPVYGCVAHIFALQQQVVSLQAQLMQVKAQLAQTLMTSNTSAAGNHQSWPSYTAAGGGAGGFPASVNSAGSPQSSMDSLEGYYSEGVGLVKQEMAAAMLQNCRDNEDYCCYYGGNNNINGSRKRVSQTDLGELQALALRMMRN